MLEINEKMNQYWKYLAIIVTGICIGMGYYIYQITHKPLASNELNINTIDKESLSYNKKTNPQYAKDVNDYFYNTQTKIRFLQDIYDFDTIKQGTDLVRDIEFVNEGDNPYFITDIKASCGCTVPSYEKEPVSPGKKGKIKIEFQSKGKEGFVMNKLAVHGNVEGGEKFCYFKIYVVK